MEYLLNVSNILCIKSVASSLLDIINQAVETFGSLLSVVVIIIGLSYIKPLKEKQKMASFSFLSQFRIRLIKISSYLKESNNNLVYLFDGEARSSWTEMVQPNPTTISDFKITVKETLEFTQNATEQMPAYFGWTNDYNELLVFLTDMIVYDICDSTSKFKFGSNATYQELVNHNVSVYQCIDKVCDRIKAEQVKMERSIILPLHKRIILYLKEKRF